MVNTKELNKELKPIGYTLVEKDGFTLIPTKRPNYKYLSMVFLGIGLLRLFQGDFIFSIIPIIGSVFIWFSNSKKIDKLALLAKRETNITINKNGLTQHNLSAKAFQFNKEKLGNLIISTNTIEGQKTIELKTSFNGNTEIQILKAFIRDDRTNEIFEKVAAIIVNIWNE